MTGPDNDDSGHNKNDSLDGYDDPGLAVQSVCLFVCLFICLFQLFVSLFIYLFICLYLFIYLPSDLTI